MEMKKILWPTDFSGSAAKALPYVTSLTQKYNTEVHVLYVIEDLAHHVDWYGDFEQPHIEKIIEWEKKKAKERLDQICENHLEGCPLYVKHIAVGDPAQEILRLMEQEKVDMVVMSSRGREGKFRFGSVAEKVVKNSRIPVVTIPIDSQSLIDEHP
jgi:nucleotide-binding universal stress UspA family protein